MLKAKAEAKDIVSKPILRPLFWPSNSCIFQCCIFTPPVMFFVSNFYVVHFQSLDIVRLLDAQRIRSRQSSTCYSVYRSALYFYSPQPWHCFTGDVDHPAPAPWTGNGNNIRPCWPLNQNRNRTWRHRCRRRRRRRWPAFPTTGRRRSNARQATPTFRTDEVNIPPATHLHCSM